MPFKFKFLVIAGISLLTPSLFGAGAQEKGPVKTKTADGVQQEKVLTVTQEEDGFIPGNLRTTIARANQLRRKNSFTTIKIKFAGQVKTIPITQGELPQITGSLIKLDCQKGPENVTIEWSPESNQFNSGKDIGLKIYSNSNSIIGCHWKGFPYAAIEIRGNRNRVQENQFGIPNAKTPRGSFSRSSHPTKGMAVLINKTSSGNLIQKNHFFGPKAYGVFIEIGGGGGNQVTENTFQKISEAIHHFPLSQNQRVPQIKQVRYANEQFYIEGQSAPYRKVQIYRFERAHQKIGQLVAQGLSSANGEFRVVTKNKGFIPGNTQILALAVSDTETTSPFSQPIAIPKMQRPKPLPMPKEEPNEDKKGRELTQDREELEEDMIEEDFANPPRDGLRPHGKAIADADLEANEEEEAHFEKPLHRQDMAAPQDKPAPEEEAW